MLIRIHPKNPDPRKIKKVVECLRDGGVIICPTDTVYGIGCDIYNKKAMEKVCRIKAIDIKKHNLSFICYNLQHIAKFTKHLSTSTYKLMKKTLPGPYTFILNANNTIPKLFKNKKKEIGIRVPDNNIARNIVKELGNPIITTSVKDKDTLIEYTSEPELIHNVLRDQIDIVIDGGYGENKPSTVINLTQNEAIILREGKGSITPFL